MPMWHTPTLVCKRAPNDFAPQQEVTAKNTNFQKKKIENRGGVAVRLKEISSLSRKSCRAVIHFLIQV